MTKYPWIQFYVSDWMNDTAMCSPATRGIWLDAIGAMHLSDRSGQLRGSIDQLSRVLRCTVSEVESAINELDVTGVAEVKREFSDAGLVIVTLINRRMLREYKEREGSKLRMKQMRGKEPVTPHVTGSVTQKSAKSNGAVTAYSQSQSQSQKEGERAREESAESQSPGSLPQNSEANPPLFSEGQEDRNLREPEKLSATEIILRQDELKRVEKVMALLRSGYNRGDRWTDADKREMDALKARKAELLNILGMKV